MKKYLLLFVNLLLITSLFSQTQNLVKRTVSILPAYNSGFNQDYNYLSQIIAGALSSSLRNSGDFVVFDDEKINKGLSDCGISESQYIWEADAIRVAETIGSSVIVAIFFQIDERNKQIRINFNAIDASTRKSAVTLSVQGSTGVTIIDTINQAAESMKTDMQRELAPYMAPFIFSPMSKIAISLTSVGGSLLIASIPVMIVGFAYFYPLVSEYLPTGDGITLDSHLIYDQYYQGLISTFSIGVTAIGLGIILCGVGIPLLVYNINIDKENQFVLEFTPSGNNLYVGLSFKF